MNPVIEKFEVANGSLRRNGLPVLLPKGLVFRALAQAGWRGTDGKLPEDVARHLIESGPFHTLFSGKVA